MDIKLDIDNSTDEFGGHIVSNSSQIAAQGYVDIELIGNGTMPTLQFRVSLDRLPVIAELSLALYTGLMNALVAVDELRRDGEH